MKVNGFLIAAINKEAVRTL